MKRFIVYFGGKVFGEWVWAENKRQARKQMTPYAHYIGCKIIKIEEV